MEDPLEIVRVFIKIFGSCLHSYMHIVLHSVAKKLRKLNCQITGKDKWVQLTLVLAWLLLGRNGEISNRDSLMKTYRLATSGSLDSWLL